MATISVLKGKRGVTYQAKVRLRGHPPVSRNFKSKTRAKTWASETEAALRRGEAVTNEARKHTIEEVVNRFLTERPELSKDPVSALNWWKHEHGHRRLSEITKPWLVEVRAGLVGEPVLNTQDGKTYRQGAATANRRVVYLAAALGKKGALGWGWMLTNPAAGIEKLPEPPGRTRWLTDEERERLIAACRESGDQTLLTLVLCALSSGARVGELLSLRWRDLDLTNVMGTGTIHTSKSGHGRTLYFASRALTALREHAKVRPITEQGRVFASGPSGRYPYQYQEPFRAACKAAGIEGFKFHDLRHTAASYMAQNGASLLEIGMVLGHRSPETTKRYAHLTKTHAKDLVARVLGEKLA
ncbi:MAG: site-specific integrase [Chromatiales bacterium]|nr:site-specific integrase [Chromatiales bacterium]